LINVPNNIDTVVGELQRIGKVNAWPAEAALVAAVCAAYTFWRQINRSRWHINSKVTRYE
jgi:hypothetical protein